MALRLLDRLSRVALYYQRPVDLVRLLHDPADHPEFYFEKESGTKVSNSLHIFCSIYSFMRTYPFPRRANVWVPVYRLNALLRFVTALVSLATVYHLVKILPVAFKQKTNAELEKEISRRKEVELLLQDANSDLSAFAYMASHDLKEPLRKISLYSGMLRDQNISNFDTKSMQLSGKITNAAKRMQELIENILTLSTIPEKINLEPVDMDSVMKNVISELELVIKEKNAAIQCDPLPVVLGNHAYLVLLFSNLVNNALKFTDSNPVIHVYSTIEGQRARIHIKDNGIGIKEEYLQKVFNTFQRLNDRAEYEGTGIGLAICKKIAAVLNGNIFAESKKGEGAVFTLELNRA